MINDAQLLEIVLHDLQKEFGRKIILSPKDLAPILGVSESSQANMRSSGAFPLPILKQGSKVGVSIYSLAKWLIEGDVSRRPLDEENRPKVPTQVNSKSLRQRRGRNDWILDL